MKAKHCQWCDTSFTTKISYQVYCSPQCREHATREKISERYEITRRNNRLKKPRKCKSCGKNLSAYNDEPLCKSCLVNPSEVNKALKDIRNLSNGKDK